MPSNRPRRRLPDIIDNIDRIRLHVGRMGYRDYLADPKPQDAVERCFQRITEAVIKLEGKRGHSTFRRLFPDRPDIACGIKK